MSSIIMPPARQLYQAIAGEETEGVDRSSSGLGRIVQKNPALTPRTSSLYKHSVHDGCAPLGFEPEGQSGSPRGESSSPPTYLAWARNLHSLLSDAEGIALFRKYLQEEGVSDTLDFWLACAGLRKQAPSPPDKVYQIVRVIYRRFFLKTQLEIDESLRKEVHSRLKDATTPIDIHVFDEACASVEKLMTETSYPNFLRSDMYLQYVQEMQNGLRVSGGSSSSGSGEASTDDGPSSRALATLHEDKELETPSFPPLTRDMLYITQERRAVGFRPKPEAFAGLYVQGSSKGGARAYSSYNPVSRQDSELQSLSSDARTESDNMSLTDSSLDGMSVSHHKMSRKQYQRHCQRVKESASLNRDPYMHQTLIPRTQRIQTDKASRNMIRREGICIHSVMATGRIKIHVNQENLSSSSDEDLYNMYSSLVGPRVIRKVHPMKPEQFAAILIKKLESVKRSQEIQEKLAHKLFETEIAEGGGPSAKSLADAIRERFQVDDDNDQDILDQHVSRVWSDLTPSRTPGISSPRPKSPDFRRVRPNQPVNKGCGTGNGPASGAHLVHHPVAVPHPYQSTRPYSTRHVRSKDKDVFSTFSSDSGNVHDYSDSLDHRLHLPKSKSMPDYPDSSDTYASLPSHDGRFRGSREWMGSSGRRYSSKKPELTDSGVSVVSESVSNHGSLPPNKDSRVLTWLIDSDRTGGCCSHSERDSASSCSGGSRYDKHHRGRRTPPPSASFPGETSLQSCVQAEEARRRIEDQSRCKQSSRQRCSSGSMSKGDSQSGGSTLKKGKSSSSEGYTTVVFSFCDEQFPYRSKIPGHSVTLRQFKEFLPKKGNYRFFFKTECEELDMQVIQEEITDDNEILPLWEGKVMAQVKPID